MNTFSEYLSKIEDPQRRARVEEVLTWVPRNFPALAPRVAWNQPMFTDHGTYIIGFGVAKKHLAVSPEKAGMEHFSADILHAGYDQSAMLFRIRWENPVNFMLLRDIIAFNIREKAHCTTFWRP